MQNEIVDPKFAAGDQTLAEDYEGFERKTLAGEGTDLGSGEGKKADRVVGDLPLIDRGIPDTGGWDTSSHAVPRD